MVAAIRLRPEWSSVGSAMLPSMPHGDKARYGFLAVSILGASISPYLMYFYSSGAIEEKWDRTYLPINRFIAGFGMTFGGVLSMAVLIVAALALRPQGIQLDTFPQAALMLTTALPKYGFYFFALSMVFACFGAALEISLAIAYFFAQGFGWNWSQNLKPSKNARFAFVYTLIILLAGIPLVLGIDPIKVTMMSMALTSATLPIAIVPFLFLMNDPIFLGKHRNGWISNSVVAIVIVISFVLALISIPLEIAGA